MDTPSIACPANTQQWWTNRNGFLLNFTVALRYSSVDKPSDYSHDAVLDLMEQYPGQTADEAVTRPVNIIGIMDESFADFSIFDGFEASEDPTPFLHSLKKNTIKGWMYSPVTGGGTDVLFHPVPAPPHRGLSAVCRDGNALSGRPGGERGV